MEGSLMDILYTTGKCGKVWDAPDECFVVL
jgi:hypothetical protein